MEFNARTNDIIMYKGDYGSSITFEVIGGEIGDKIVFCFEDKLEDKVFEIDTVASEANSENPFVFDFDFDEADISPFRELKYGIKIPYSIKHYRNDELLDTILNGFLIIKDTVILDEQLKN